MNSHAITDSDPSDLDSFELLEWYGRNLDHNRALGIVIDAEDEHLLCEHRWHLCGQRQKYARRRGPNGTHVYLSHEVGREVFGDALQPGKRVMPRNGNGLDVRRSNLKTATSRSLDAERSRA